MFHIYLVLWFHAVYSPILTLLYVCIRFALNCIKTFHVVEKTNLTIPGQDKTLSLSHDKLSLAASVQNMMLASELDISNVRPAHRSCPK